MHILVLNFEYPPLGGGASPVCHEINTRYVRAGHRVTVVTMPHKQLPAFEDMDGVEVHRVPCWRKHLHMCHPHEQLTYILRARSFLKSWLKENQPDVCHAHFILPTGLLCRWLNKKYGIRSIITAHGSDVPGFNPDRFLFLHHFTPPLIRSIIRHTAMITSPSVYLSELIREVMPADHQNVMVIPNGIEATRFTRGEKSFYIVSSGRLLPRKGFKELIIAVRELDIPGGLHILGDGPIRAELESLAEGSKTPVTFHGWMDNRSPAYMKMLANASVYCLVSARENASISILEAMASGCAVITSDGSGCPEMVGDAGILVPHGQPDAIRKALVQLSTSPELCEQLSLQAIRRVKEIYDWDQITARFLTLLQQHTIAGRS